MEKPYCTDYLKRAWHIWGVCWYALVSGSISSMLYPNLTSAPGPETSKEVAANGWPGDPPYDGGRVAGFRVYDPAP